MLKPACSFSNTDGGDLIYGIHAEYGLPVSLVGIEIDDVDKKKLSLEPSFQNGIEPQLRGLNIKEVKMDNGRYVLIIRIPKSWVGPHRIKSNARFYARNTAGAYELLGYEAPMYVSLALAGARGYSLAVDQGALGHELASPFDRDVLIISDEELQSTHVDGIKIMKPMFDVIWNAAGYPSSRNFDANNNRLYGGL